MGIFASISLPVLKEKGSTESFKCKLFDVLQDRGIFFALEEAKILIARWVEEYNMISPNNSLGYYSSCATDLAVGSATSCHCSKTNITTGIYVGDWLVLSEFIFIK